MPYTMEDFRRDTARQYLNTLSLDEILQQFPANEVLQRFSVDELLRQFSVDEIRAYLQKREQQPKE
ncbi:hypothetical protein HYR99_40460 [Candidatus Poribacteria bacterium]|nr:hypothetical protein [Candidatus Poribacteria bacterium]